MNVQCWLGHKWVEFHRGNLNRIVDQKTVGCYVLLKCSRCGDVKQKRFL